MSRKIHFEFDEKNSMLLLAAVRHAKIKAECAAVQISELDTDEAVIQMRNYYSQLERLEKRIMYEIERQIYPS